MPPTAIPLSHYMHALYVCLVCMPYMYAVYVSRVCMLDMYALYACLTVMPPTAAPLSHYMHALHVGLVCMPSMYALYVCLICVCLICMPYTCMPYMYALYVCPTCVCLICVCLIRCLTMVLTRGRVREQGEYGKRVMAPVAPQESWASDSFASSNKVGLGLTFVKPDGQPGVVVKRVKEGGAAAASGRLFPGDRVMQIDGEDLLHMTSKVLTNLVMGPEGSVARLRVKRVEGAYEDVTVPRRFLDPDGASKYGELRSEPSLDFGHGGGTGGEGRRR